MDFPFLHCYRCGNTWTPRRQVVRICPRCKSRYFDEPKLTVPSIGEGDGIEEVLGPYRREIRQLARKYGVREIRVFGSVARHLAKAKSDVDLLVDFRGTPRTSDFRRELERLLGRRVDVVTEARLHWFIQPQIIVEAMPL